MSREDEYIFFFVSRFNLYCCRFLRYAVYVIFFQLCFIVTVMRKNTFFCFSLVLLCFHYISCRGVWWKLLSLSVFFPPFFCFTFSLVSHFNSSAFITYFTFLLFLLSSCEICCFLLYMSTYLYITFIFFCSFLFCLITC